ncbi:IS3 family transposase, partial [Streptomyces sp. NEAU-W12]|uniref:IS3 family transposase n=1 Tax=Streptomyces sp. NEAU-W12 TaxID=2994668 RepID=UPI00224B80A9
MVMIRFRFVDEHRTTHRVKWICDVLGWDRSGYYAWRRNKETRQDKAGAEEELARRIREIHTASRGAYGARRITRKLRDQDQVVNRKRVARLMREHEIVGITRRRARSLTKADRTASPAPDLVGRDFTAPMPGLKLVGDITCLPTAEGWLYLATVIDLCTREGRGLVDGRPYAHGAGLGRHPDGSRGRTHGRQRDLPFRPLESGQYTSH